MRVWLLLADSGDPSPLHVDSLFYILADLSYLTKDRVWLEDGWRVPWLRSPHFGCPHRKASQMLDH